MKKSNKFNKFDEAAGLFWGASLFIGVLTSIIIGFCSDSDMGFEWIFAVLVGACTFLIIGLVTQGLISLLKKDGESEKNKEN